MRTAKTTTEPNSTPLTEEILSREPLDLKYSVALKFILVRSWTTGQNFLEWYTTLFCGFVLNPSHRGAAKRGRAPYEELLDAGFTTHSLSCIEVSVCYTWAAFFLSFLPRSRLKIDSIYGVARCSKIVNLPREFPALPKSFAKMPTAKQLHPSVLNFRAFLIMYRVKACQNISQKLQIMPFIETEAHQTI